MVLSCTSTPLPPLHDVVFDQEQGLPFSDSSVSTAVVKITSKFKWRLTLPGLSLFPFQTSMLKIYSVGDKQDAAALGPWRSWKLTSVFTDVLWDWAKSLVFNSLSTAPSKDTNQAVTDSKKYQGSIKKTIENSEITKHTFLVYANFILFKNIYIKDMFSYHFILRPALLYQFGYRLLHQTLESFSCIIAALVKLRTITKKLRILIIIKNKYILKKELRWHLSLQWHRRDILSCTDFSLSRLQSLHAGVSEPFLEFVFIWQCSLRRQERQRRDMQ